MARITPNPQDTPNCIDPALACKFIAPPVQAPPVEAPPVEAPLVEALPVEAPPVEVPPVGFVNRRSPTGGAWTVGANHRCELTA